MDEIKVQCPLCRQELEAPEDMMGTVVECPQCCQKFRLPSVYRQVPYLPDNQGKPQKRIILKGHVNSPYVAHKQAKQYDGIGRLGFWLLPNLVGLVFAFGIGFSGILGELTRVPQIGYKEHAAGVALVGLVLAVFFPVFIVWLFAGRMRNMGYSGWYALLIFLPVASIGVGLMCACFPEGFRDKRKIDAVGWVLIPVFILQAVIGIFVQFKILSEMFS